MFRHISSHLHIINILLDILLLKMAHEEKVCRSYGVLPRKVGNSMCSIPRLASQIEQVVPDSSRRENSSWCLCGRCVVMPTALECVCCREVEAVRSKLTSNATVQCISQHHEFKGVCIEQYVLRAVATLLHDEQCRPLEDPISNRLLILQCYLYLCIDGL